MNRLSIPCFFSLETLFGAFLVVIGAVGYGICSVKGETPPLPEKDTAEETNNQDQSWFSGSEESQPSSYRSYQ